MSIPISTPFNTPCLCLVTDREISGGDQVTKVAQAVAGGVDFVQLREKDLPGSQLLDLATSIKEAIGDSALLVINERTDIAAYLGVGTQLGEEAVPVPVARRIVGAGSLIGRSVHSEEGAAAAQAEGADFLVVGTMYETRSHPGAEPAGPPLLRKIAETCTLPILGIGGITAANLGELIRSGASGVAVISSILAAPDPKEAARLLKQAMLEVWSVRQTTAQPGGL